jgi:hypothetical protein
MQPKERIFYVKLAGLFVIMSAITVVFISLVLSYSQTTSVTAAGNLKASSSTNSQAALITNASQADPEIDLNLGSSSIKSSGRFALVLIVSGALLVGFTYIIAKMKA